MSIELRSITVEEVPTFLAVEAIGFGQDYKPDGDERFPSRMSLDRTVAAFDGDELVATLGDFELKLTVPGGTQVATAGTTMVTVQATHTRQGILRSMITRHLDNAIERGEPIAGLWASEPGIYGRFGFGLASELHEVKIDTRHLAKRSPAPDVRLTMVPASKIPEVVAPFWSKIATSRAGFIDRGEQRWQDIMDDPEAHHGGATAVRHVVARRSGEVVGYLAYRQNDKWEDGLSIGSVSIRALVASDLDAHLSLWAYTLDIDLFPNVSFWNGAIDDPLAFEVSNSRAVKRSVGDALYVRILDVEAALMARTYEQDGDIVFAVDDDMGYADGTYRLVITDGVAAVEKTSDTAVVTLGIRELGALYLGRSSANLYTTTGQITGELEAVRLLGQLFVTERAPWCPEMF